MTEADVPKRKSSYFARMSFCPKDDDADYKREKDEMISAYIAADNKSSGLTDAYQKRIKEHLQKKKEYSKMYRDMKWKTQNEVFEPSVSVISKNLPQSTGILENLKGKIESCEEQKQLLLHKCEEMVAVQTESVDNLRMIAKRKTAAAAETIIKNESEKLDACFYEVVDMHTCSVPAIL